MSRGFTLIEMAVVITISALVIPLVFAFAHTYEVDHLRAADSAQAASSMRAVSEELRRDLQTMRVAEEPGLVLVGAGKCARVEYAVADEVLLRRACDEVRAVARHVQALRREGRSLTVEFGRPLRPDLPSQTSFRLAW
jgi:prepilin-type N-terminal cleavage/methylation domain-containing protein